MARIPYVDRDELPEECRDVYDQLVAERRRPVGNVFRMVGNTPGVLRHFVALVGELRHRTALDPKLRELALMTVGRLTGADYELVHHWNIALQAGVARGQLEHLADFETSPLFSDEERAVMRYAVEATRDVKVSDATFDALGRFLDTRRMAELVQNVAFYNMVVRVLVPLGVEVEPDIKRL